MKHLIKNITSAETYPVRHPVLRQGKPIESCIFDGDDLKTTLHLGIYINSKLVGVCSFFKNNHRLVSESHQYQLRGMAVLKDYQGQGLGNLILKHGEDLVKNLNTQIVWCNAREIATTFYKKNNYKIISPPFNIEDVGTHFVMSKTL